ncbi:MAG: transcription termination factor Rho [Myxococcota bacterium]
MSVDLSALRAQKITRLVETARRLGLDNAASLRKQDLVFEIIRRQPNGGSARGSGVLEILPDGFGFLRSPDANFLPGSDDIYVSPSQIRRFNLRTGDQIRGRVRSPKDGERYFALIKIERVNGRSPDDERDKILYDNLTAVRPFRALQIGDTIVGRMIDGYVPLAFGQRVLVLADARSGRSNLLARIAQAASPKLTVLMLLIDERPEEITAMQRELSSIEVISTTLDEPPSRHMQVAEMALERCKRLVEQGRDVMLLVDSLTRLTRALHATDNRSTPDPQTVYRTRQFFAAGRQLEEGGSLTIIATALRGVDPTHADLVDELHDASNAVLHLVAAPWLDEIPAGVPGLHLGHSFARQQELYLDKDGLLALRARRKALSREPRESLAQALETVGGDEE